LGFPKRRNFALEAVGDSARLNAAAVIAVIARYLIDPIKTLLLDCCFVKDSKDEQ